MKTNSPLISVREEGDVRVVQASDGRCSLTVGAGAAAEFLVVQDEAGEREWSFAISLAEGASLRMVFLSLQGDVLRNRLDVALEGRHATCDLAGLYLAGGTRQAEFDICLEHRVPECHSTQLFKGIVDGHGTTRFHGLVRVVPDAQKTEAYQANHNLLLSETARAFTKPQLEIYADDVKCSHGATIGRLNEDELFYMRSRGIPVAEARLLQQMAFAGEVLEKISSQELRESLWSRIEKQLREGI